MPPFQINYYNLNLNWNQMDPTRDHSLGKQIQSTKRRQRKQERGRTDLSQPTGHAEEAVIDRSSLRLLEEMKNENWISQHPAATT